nr:alpha/beta hydrolase [Kineococcus vitellinus]
MLHAGVCDRRSWRAVTDRLPGVATLAHDRRGFGGSTPAGEGDPTHLQDLRAVLDHVQGAAAGEPVVLVGSSMGGGLALDAALELPERVAALLLLAPAVSGAPAPAAADLDERTLALDAAADEALARGDVEEALEPCLQLWLDGPASPGRVGGAVRELARDSARAALRGGGADTGAGEVDAWSRLGELAVPVTVATGDLDVPYLLRRTEELLERVPGARRAALPGTAHLPQLEAPDLVADLVVRLLADVAAVGAADGAVWPRERAQT